MKNVLFNLLEELKNLKISSLQEYFTFFAKNSEIKSNSSEILGPKITKVPDTPNNSFQLPKNWILFPNSLQKNLNIREDLIFSKFSILPVN